MLLKITEHCSMGCTHCLNNALPNNNHMSMETLVDSLEFIKKTKLEPVIIVSGGEPTEHPRFMELMTTIIGYCISNLTSSHIIIASNGLWFEANIELLKSLLFKVPNHSISIQITNIEKYYPKRININNPIYKIEEVSLINPEDITIYPAGRAVTNNIPSYSKGSKCFNIRALSNQLTDPTLGAVSSELRKFNKFCTPSIKVNGDIILGESDLCKTACTIYDKEENIVSIIQNFTCDNCNHINDNLPPEYKRLLKPFR